MARLGQMSLFDAFEIPAHQMNGPLLAALDALATSNVEEERGAVFTRAEVVEFILDLVGYDADEKLYNKRILEPSFGNGDFLLLIIDRLLKSWIKHSSNYSLIFVELSNSICAVEIHSETYKNTKRDVINIINEAGIDREMAIKLADSWLIQGDFLLIGQRENYDYVVGNPPYLRQEAIPEPLLKEYKFRYRTIYDRADLYIPFIERSLTLLNSKGVLGFICSDRWMKNRYGGPLRKLVSNGFNLKAYIDMVETDAFHKEVSVYPAITVISREKQGATRIGHRPKIEKNTLRSLAKEVLGQEIADSSEVKEVAGIVNASEPWIIKPTAQFDLLRKIENSYPTLEEAGCRVGIGVATGADKIFIADFNKLDIEEDRKIPLITTKDIQTGEINWLGQCVINTFNDSGLVDLINYPKLSRYLYLHEETIKNRHIAKKHPDNWFRTIDRIWPDLTIKEKLLIPDIKGEAHIVYESGKYYPHHNLYYITSEEWNLRALQAVLLSNIAKLFISTYSTKIRGGYLRFQAQYLRRIRIPKWGEVPHELRQELISAAIERNISKCNEAVFKLYKLNHEERSALGGN
ncbi:MAG: N-6 DNA methylase [Syntrophomonadaceae bacterium]|nr:N-6 DNA methylase [Syntrophomonadaceae bacterium]